MQAFHQIARKLQLPACDDPNTDVCELAFTWLDEEESHWLMIVDNADSADLLSSVSLEVLPASGTRTQRRLIEYLPTMLHSSKSILVTTRSRHVGQDLANGVPGIEVPPFSSQEAMELLQSKTKGAPADSFDKHVSEKLLDILGCNPLAITQAAAFINRNQMTISSYLADLGLDKQNLADYLSQDLQDPRRQ